MTWEIGLKFLILAITLATSYADLYEELEEILAEKRNEIISGSKDVIRIISDHGEKRLREKRQVPFSYFYIDPEPELERVRSARDEVVQRLAMTKNSRNMKKKPLVGRNDRVDKTKHWTTDRVRNTRRDMEDVFDFLKHKYETSGAVANKIDIGDERDFKMVPLATIVDDMIKGAVKAFKPIYLLAAKVISEITKLNKDKLEQEFKKDIEDEMREVVVKTVERSISSNKSNATGADEKENFLIENLPLIKDKPIGRQFLGLGLLSVATYVPIVVAKIVESAADVVKHAASKTLDLLDPSHQHHSPSQSNTNNGPSISTNVNVNVNTEQIAEKIIQALSKKQDERHVYLKNENTDVVIQDMFNRKVSIIRQAAIDYLIDILITEIVDKELKDKVLIDIKEALLRAVNDTNSDDYVTIETYERSNELLSKEMFDIADRYSLLISDYIRENLIINPSEVENILNAKENRKFYETRRNSVPRIGYWLLITVKHFVRQSADAIKEGLEFQDAGRLPNVQDDLKEVIRHDLIQTYESLSKVETNVSNMFLRKIVQKVTEAFINLHTRGALREFEKGLHSVIPHDIDRQDKQKLSFGKIANSMDNNTDLFKFAEEDANKSIEGESKVTTEPRWRGCGDNTSKPQGRRSDIRRFHLAHLRAGLMIKKAKYRRHVPL